MICIYRIRNLVTGAAYVGQTVEFEKRREWHLRRLLRREHPNYKLQREFDLYGIAFVVEVLKKCPYRLRKSPSDEYLERYRVERWLDANERIYVGLERYSLNIATTKMRSICLSYFESRYRRRATQVLPAARFITIRKNPRFPR